MANELILTNARILIESEDFTTYSNEVAFNPEVDPQDASRMGSAWRVRAGGAKSAGFQVSGFQIDETTRVMPDDKLDVTGPASLLGEEETFCFSPAGGVAGDHCWFGESLFTTYQFESTWGKLAGFVANFFCKGGLGTYFFRGKSLGTYTAASGTANGTSVSYLHLDAGKVLTALIQVYAFSATSLVVKIQSSPNGSTGWADKVTFATATGKTHELKTYNTPTTDTYWRVTYTLVGSSATFHVAMFIDH